MLPVNIRQTTALIALIAGLSSGCSFTTMETARQLESGEAVVGGSLDWPGLLYIPRASAYGKVGVGDKADLGLQAGFAFMTANLGASARLYPSDWLTLSLQTETVFVLGDSNDFSFGSDGRRAALINFTPRVSTALNEGDLFYAGVQSNVMTGFESNDSGTGSTYQFRGATLGGFVGLEYDLRERLALQAEFIMMPVSVDEEGRMNVLFFGESGIPALAQLSVGMNYRFGGSEPLATIPASSDAPAQVQAPAEPARPTEPAPEPEPEKPQYDKSGVPIY
ncbi:hypothetical protein DL240_13730 [Lujinxingia litoralis]|uniref:Outer membrane protein beta-barrel domain-containing protein n=1 Tax=Lujinxingia litoralis TaxID=2211119 RepID=A0A328C3L4_9DELT|nr:hypothetical protein [Lujinxingia litoralis]RAL21188.1 hypothetical protein DL240_13730 [Lujinxingia litoralis]